MSFAEKIRFFLVEDHFLCILDDNVIFGRSYMLRVILSYFLRRRLGNDYFAVDGDTLRCGNEKIRLFGMDAPEEGQNCFGDYDAGNAAHRMLESLCGGEAHLLVLDKDVYGRTVGLVSTPIYKDLSYEMIARGYAIPLDKAPPIYWAAFHEARANEIGLWAWGGFEEPRLWRNRLKEKTGLPFIHWKDRPKPMCFDFDDVLGAD